MERVTAEEAKNLIEQDKERITKIIEEGGKATKTIIEEKDKITTILKIEPVRGKPTSSKIVISKDGISGQIFNVNP